MSYHSKDYKAKVLKKWWDSGKTAKLNEEESQIIAEYDIDTKKDGTVHDLRKLIDHYFDY